MYKNELLYQIFGAVLYMTHPLSCRLLLNGGQLIAVHKAKYYKREDGLALGPGPFVSALEYASDKEALVVGKPEPGFFESVLSELNCPADEVVMIGDVSKSLNCNCA